MRLDGSFQSAYKELEARFKERADADKRVYLPSPEPEGPVDYVFICWEPSLRGWARDEKEAQQKVDAGFRNFLAGIETSILHFCIQHDLCTQRYHITDLSKGVMKVGDAKDDRCQRWNQWYPLLEKELKLVAPDAVTVAVGNEVYDYLRSKGLDGLRTVMKVMHYSNQAGRKRNEEAMKLGFQEFSEEVRDSVLNEVIATAKALLMRHMPTMWEERLKMLENKRLTPSRQKLISVYKSQFESIRARTNRKAQGG